MSSGSGVEAEDFGATRAAIAALADAAGVSASVVDRSSFAYGIGEVFSDHMKVADLGILTGRRGPLVGERLLAQAALFDSGRPLVIAPKTGPPLPRRALIAWDGTHAAARAMQDAICGPRPGGRGDCRPRHRRQGAADGPVRDRGGAPPRPPRHQGRIPRDPAQWPRHLRRAPRRPKDAGCDLIVAGAVRHSPIHELIFGSVTGRVLDGDCDLPVLLSA
jgi:hypothetical protein